MGVSGWLLVPCFVLISWTHMCFSLASTALGRLCSVGYMPPSLWCLTTAMDVLSYWLPLSSRRLGSLLTLLPEWGRYGPGARNSVRGGTPVPTASSFLPRSSALLLRRQVTETVPSPGLISKQAGNPTEEGYLHPRDSMSPGGFQACSQRTGLPIQKPLGLLSYIFLLVKHLT